MRTFVHKDTATVAIVLAIATALALWLFAADASRSGRGRVAMSQKAHEPVTIDSTPFRYGPEINHGRGDTPVGAREQALKEARESGPAEFDAPSTARRSYRSASESFLNRGLRSGH